MTGLGQRVQDGVRVVDRRRHERLGLAAGKAEHQALVAGPFVLVALASTPWAMSTDWRGSGIPPCVLPVKAILLVADVADRMARGLDSSSLVTELGRAHLAGHHHALVVRDLARDAANAGSAARKVSDHHVELGHQGAAGRAGRAAMRSATSATSRMASLEARQGECLIHAQSVDIAQGVDASGNKDKGPATRA